MTKDEFIAMLKEHEINADIVGFNENTRDGYCIRKDYFRWETLFRERGKEYDVLGHPSESDALEYMCDKLIQVYLKKT